jgi:hypothetical protein
MLRAVSAILAGLLLGGPASANPYKGRIVSGLDTELAYDKILHTDDGNVMVPLTISFEQSASPEERGSFSPEIIKENIAISHRELREFFDEKGYKLQPCQNYYTLHIFVLSNKTMFESGLFDFWKKQNNATIVYAFYDATIEVRAEDNIIFSHMSHTMDFESMQHELAHYWYNKYCLSDLYPDSEIFARTIEDRSRVYYHEYFSN